MLSSELMHYLEGERAQEASESLKLLTAFQQHLLHSPFSTKPRQQHQNPPCWLSDSWRLLDGPSGNKLRKQPLFLFHKKVTGACDPMDFNLWLLRPWDSEQEYWSGMCLLQYLNSFCKWTARLPNGQRILWARERLMMFQSKLFYIG